jgi:phosphoenolpyruvate synthase/pyruvate phosphate dikinase
VTTTTNIGWTPVFPRAMAIVTNVVAPLLPAASVARELGIPAVMGCNDTTMRLHTGDRIRVDGGKGAVEILKPPRHKHRQKEDRMGGKDAPASDAGLLRPIPGNRFPGRKSIGK